ncbi:MAG: galactokinase family protein [Planctomycetota bacterium]
MPAEPRKPDELLRALEGAECLKYLSRQIYGDRDPAWLQKQRQRYIDTVKLHRQRFGDQPICLLRAPGRLNLFLEYLDMCHGDHMSTTMDGDIPMVVSPAQEDPDRVRVLNENPLFGYDEFRIAQETARFLAAPWEDPALEGIPDTWERRTRIHACYGRQRGDSLNYILAPFLRMSYDHRELRLRGCDLTIGASTIPIRAGTSSSSAMVVLATLAMWLSNADQMPAMNIRHVCRFLGEAEWYVGTRGGANDQTSILRNEVNGILYNLHHLELIDSVVLPWLRGVDVILCNSLWEADKALGARYIFNMRKGWMDLARDLMQEILDRVGNRVLQGGPMHAGWIAEIMGRLFPGHDPPGIERLESHPECWEKLAKQFRHLGSLDQGLMGLELPVIEAFIDLLPAFVYPVDAKRILSKTEADLDRDYTLPRQGDKAYEPRQAARFFFHENRIGRALEALLIEADARLRTKDLSEDSPSYEVYRLKVAGFMNDVQKGLKEVFQVSHPQLELLLGIAAKGPGYMAGKLTGAGSGGCVCLLVKKGTADEMIAWLDLHYFKRVENFESYREALDRLAASPDPQDRAKAREMKDNLEQALGRLSEQRKLICFSKGACVVDPGRP